MPQVKDTVYIDAPPDVVWNFLADLSRMTEYVHFVNEIFDYPEPQDLGVGSTYKERAKPDPFESISTWEFTEWNPFQSAVQKGAMPEMKADIYQEFKPLDGGTQYTQWMDFEFLPKFRPLGWLLERLVIQRKMQSDVKQILSTIKHIIESEYQPVMAGER